MSPRDEALWLCFLLSCVTAEVLHSVVRKPNSVSTINATCSADSLSVTVRMRQSFQGLIYARGFPLECSARGTGDREVTLHLPAMGCGVRVQPSEDGETLNYVVSLEVQLDRHLQQAADQQRTVSCRLPPDGLAPALNIPRPSARMARKKEDDIPSTDFHQKTARAWMEIRGTNSQGQVSVGEDTTLLVKAVLPAELSSHVTDCTAHDGAGESSQRLLDDRGCPIDELILPALAQQQRKTADNSEFNLLTSKATFAAFKFPDRNSLHLRCTLEICRGHCKPGEVLEHVQVFNSVEVLAPGIELDDLENLMNSVAVALYTLMRGRRQHHRSKLLLAEETLVVQDSPFMGHRIQWPHVRIMD
ncbi:hypothetical protein C0J52_01957 [Blattella germanica]|nr:hypothetical protein C0J52_01957 [Blattella germanica]